VIGLVGGIGAGKSRVADEMARRGAFVLDADAVGHALLDQPPAREEVLKRFGPEVLDATEAGDGARIDRKALGALVFADRHALRDLERILHPRMRRTFERAIARTERRGEAKAFVLDAAVLFEAGWDDLCDTVVFVDAPREQRLARLTTARGWSHEFLAAREQAQLPLAEKQRRASAVIANHSSPDHLAAEVERLWIQLTKRPSRPTGEPGAA
jgi:dephospho-CoA kinase